MDQELDSVSQKLLQVSELVQTSITQLIIARRGRPSDEHSATDLPEWDLFNAQRTLLAAAGTLTELASEPRGRLLEVSSQYFEARALHIAVDARIPDILGESGHGGLGIDGLASRVGIEWRKLSRIMRCLCSIHIFREVGPDVFANNSISESLVNNEPLRAYILLFALDLYTSSDHLPKTLYDENKGPSYKVNETAWQEATGTTKPRWDWLEETTSVAELSGGSKSVKTPVAYPGVFGSELKNAIRRAAGNGAQLVKRPEHAIFSLAMVGGGQVTGRAPLHDFPWASLGSATVVDVGGGVGGFCLQLSQLYSDLRFVLQDRGDAIEKARSEVWPHENAAALASGRIEFVVHDFFDVNPVRGADVYWLRYVLHDWSDEYCVRILGAIKESMGPRSRILICDQVMNTASGCPELTPAPAPLLANWGYYMRYSHQRDLAMMAIINGIERKPEEFRALAKRAGLRLRKIWDCRSQVGLVEMVLLDSELQ